MRPAIYFHDTPKDERPKPVIECKKSEDKTRQEFKNESDANWLLKRYGANVPFLNVQYGEQDFDLDRLTAINAIQRLEDSFSQLPEHIQARYGNWDNVFKAIQSGDLTTLQAAQEASKAAGDTSGTPQAG